MTRLAFIGGAGIYHARAFTGLVNEVDKAAFQAAGFPVFEQPPLPDVEVVAVWDQDRALAERLAALGRIPRVLDRPEQAIGLADGIMVLDDTSMVHQRQARPFLEAGLPTFIDKPLSPDPKEAAEIIALARRHDAPLMSCSALRYSRELAEAQADLAAIGPIGLATASGPNEIVFYGIHPLELAHTVMGPGVEWVQNVGDAEGRAIVRCAYPDGRSIMLQVLKQEQPSLQAMFFGAKGYRLVEVSDGGAFYQRMIAEFVRMVHTRQTPIPLDTTLELMRILAGGKLSAQEGGSRIALADL